MKTRHILMILGLVWLLGCTSNTMHTKNQSSQTKFDFEVVALRMPDDTNLLFSTKAGRKLYPHDLEKELKDIATLSTSSHCLVRFSQFLPLLDVMDVMRMFERENLTNTTYRIVLQHPKKDLTREVLILEEREN